METIPDRRRIKFGFCLPVFANPGMTFFRTPAYEKLDWDSLKDSVLFCDENGFDSLFIADHLFLGRDGDIWECTVLMSAFAVLTQNIEIIPIHLCNNFRTPSIVAKMLSTMSHMCNGRLALFYDYGWRRAEFNAYGIDFGKNDDERVRQMEEGLTIIKGMLEEESFSFSGDFYKVSNAICKPKPVRKIPLWMGEINNGNMVKCIVSHADVFNSMPCSVEVLKKKLEIVNSECQVQQRDFNSLDFSLETQILVRESDEEITDFLDHINSLKKYNNSHDSDILEQLHATNSNFNYFNKELLMNEFLIGTPDVIKERIQQYINCGITHFMLWFMDFPSRTGMKLFVDKILPTMRHA